MAFKCDPDATVCLSVYSEDLLKDSFVVMEDDAVTSFTDHPQSSVKFDVNDTATEHLTEVMLIEMIIYVDYNILIIMYANYYVFQWVLAHVTCDNYVWYNNLFCSPYLRDHFQLSWKFAEKVDKNYCIEIRQNYLALN